MPPQMPPHARVGPKRLRYPGTRTGGYLGRACCRCGNSERIGARGAGGRRGSRHLLLVSEAQLREELDAVATPRPRVVRHHRQHLLHRPAAEASAGGMRVRATIVARAQPQSQLRTADAGADNRAAAPCRIAAAPLSS
eukprot:364134-Prorocentrum_minimum.AAC.1